MSTIILGEGIDQIKFGITRDELKAILGEPDEVELFANSDEQNDRTEAFHYDEMEVSFSFDEIDDWKLSSIAVSNEEAILEGKQLIGKTQQEVIDILEVMDLGDMDIEDLSNEENPDHQVILFPDLSLNLWFEDGLLSEIQFGPFWNDEDELMIWPN